MKLIFEKSYKGKNKFDLINDVHTSISIDSKNIRKESIGLPDVSELECVRHYIGLSKNNLGVDNAMYPLGSCTMKYNPKINEQLAMESQFINLHPEMPVDYTQNILKIVYDLQNDLSEITGMDAYSAVPCAGAHGEYLGLYIIKSYLVEKGETERNIILVPDSSHGTNPASASMTGFNVRTIKSDSTGLVDVEDLKKNLNSKVAGLMLTNPNTLGLFEKDILKIADLVHNAGGLLYYDGANFNAIMGYAKVGVMNFDVLHLNLHKTFSTPHGGGGPGAGPVGVKDYLKKYLPSPKIFFENNRYYLNDDNDIFIHSFLGNISVLIKAYTYIKLLGAEDLKQVSEVAVLNANYMRKKLQDVLDIPFNTVCKHEFVASAKSLKEKYGIKALDIAKGLINEGVYAPTVYFPIIVSESIMIEPTETEPLTTIDNYCNLIIDLVEKGKQDINSIAKLPDKLSVSRLDEVKAVKEAKLKFT